MANSFDPSIYKLISSDRIACKGEVERFEVNPGTLIFQGIDANELSEARSFEIKNTGDKPLSVYEIISPDQWQIGWDGNPFTLEPNETRIINVIHAPVTNTIRYGDILISAGLYSRVRAVVLFGSPDAEIIFGIDGDDGQDGQDGEDGAPGLSAYQIAVLNGFNGTEAEWLESLVGPPGETSSVDQVARDAAAAAQETANEALLAGNSGSGSFSSKKAIYLLNQPVIGIPPNSSLALSFLGGYEDGSFFDGDPTKIILNESGFYLVSLTGATTISSFGNTANISNLRFSLRRNNIFSSGRFDNLELNGGTFQTIGQYLGSSDWHQLIATNTHQTEGVGLGGSSRIRFSFFKIS